VKTADAIAARRTGSCCHGNLNDIDCGEWQGKSVNEVKEEYPDIYQDWLDTPEQVRIPAAKAWRKLDAG